MRRRTFTRGVSLLTTVLLAAGGAAWYGSRSDDGPPRAATAVHAELDLADGPDPAAVEIPEVDAGPDGAVVPVPDPIDAGPPPPVLRAADGRRVALPQAPDDDAGTTLRYAEAARAAHRSGNPRITPLSEAALAAYEQLRALELDQEVSWEETDTEPLEREAGEEPDPLRVLWAELHKID